MESGFAMLVMFYDMQEFKSYGTEKFGFDTAICLWGFISVRIISNVLFGRVDTEFIKG